MVIGQLIFLVIYRFNWNNFADYLILNEEIAQVERYNVELENRIIKEKEEIFEKTLTSVVPKRLKRRITDHIIGKEKFREYGDVIILFTKINNFKNILKSMPIEESSKLIESYMNITASFPRNYDGQLDKHIGEVSMVVFGVKSKCDESLARNVLSYVKQVNQLMKTQHSISLSHGISYGRSLYGVFGSADSPLCFHCFFSNYVNEAARLMQLADDESILISESFANEFRAIGLREHKILHLKGLEIEGVYLLS